MGAGFPLGLFIFPGTRERVRKSEHQIYNIIADVIAYVVVEQILTFNEAIL